MRALDLLEMNIPRDLAIARLINLEDQINTHLIKLLGFVADDGVRAHWKKELDAWLSGLAVLRLKGKGKQGGKPPSAQVYYDNLYDHIYGQHETQNVNAKLYLLVRQGYVRNPEPVADIVRRLRTFHQGLSLRLATQRPYNEMIDEL